MLAGRTELSAGDGMTFERFDGESPAVSQEAVSKEAPDEWHVGEIKSFAQQQGYGFIQCDDTFARYKNDVFLHKKQVDEAGLRKISLKDKLRFTVELNKNGRPQARKVERFKEVPKVSQEKTFVGRVKKFEANAGYGFIACDETRALFGADIFLHRNQAIEAGAEAGSMVTFAVEVSGKGQPQARNVAKFVRSDAAAALP